MPKTPEILKRVRKKAVKTEERLREKIEEHQEWRKHFPPQKMAELVAQTRRAEQPFAAELKKVSLKVLARLFGLQATELLEGFNVTGELAQGPSAPKFKPVQKRKISKIVQSQQRVRALSEAMGLISQDLFLQTLRKENPQVFQKLFPYYEPFMNITRHAFHAKPRPGETALGLGQATAQLKFLKAQSKTDPEDIRIIPSDALAKIQNAPTHLLLVNEAAEAITMLMLKQSQARMAFLKTPEREAIEKRLHSLQYRQLRYQQGEHYYRALSPLFVQVARLQQERQPKADIGALIRQTWDKFLSLPTKQQDKLSNAFLKAKSQAQKKQIGNAVLKIIQKK